MLGVTGCPNTIHTVTVTVVSCSDSIVYLDNVVEITGYTLNVNQKKPIGVKSENTYFAQIVVDKGLYRPPQPCCPSETRNQHTRQSTLS